MSYMNKQMLLNKTLANIRHRNIGSSLNLARIRAWAQLPYYVCVYVGCFCHFQPSNHFHAIDYVCSHSRDKRPFWYELVLENHVHVRVSCSMKFHIESYIVSVWCTWLLWSSRTLSSCNQYTSTRHLWMCIMECLNSLNELLDHSAL